MLGARAQDDDLRREIGQKTEILHIEFEKAAGSPRCDDPVREYDTALSADGSADTDFTPVITLNRMAFADIVEYEFHGSTIPYSNPGKKSVLF